MGDGEDALHAEEVFAIPVEQLADPRLQQLQVKLARLHQAQVARRALVEAHTRDRAVVLGLWRVGIQQLWARLQRARQIEAIDVEHGVD